MLSQPPVPKEVRNGFCEEIIISASCVENVQAELEFCTESSETLNASISVNISSLVQQMQANCTLTASIPFYVGNNLCYSATNSIQYNTTMRGKLTLSGLACKMTIVRFCYFPPEPNDKEKSKSK